MKKVIFLTICFIGTIIFIISCSSDSPKNDETSTTIISSTSTIQISTTTIQTSTSSTLISTTTTIFNSLSMVTVTGSTTNLHERMITISTFQIGKYEVTYKLWYEVYKWAISTDRTIEKRYSFQNQGKEGSGGITGAIPTVSNEPVTDINWRDAIIWCNALSEKEGLKPIYCIDSTFTTPIRSSVTVPGGLKTTPGEIDNPYINRSNTGTGYRLPTESEWEFAAIYKDGNNWNSFNNLSGANTSYYDNTECIAVAIFGLYQNGTPTGITKTSNVASKRANALDIYDMSGNIMEWTNNWYDSNPPTTPETDPIGPTLGSYRIAKGGSWLRNVGDCNIYYKDVISPTFKITEVGFRLAKKL